MAQVEHSWGSCCHIAVAEVDILADVDILAAADIVAAADIAVDLGTTFLVIFCLTNYSSYCRMFFTGGYKKKKKRSEVIPNPCFHLHNRFQVLKRAASFS